MVRDRITIIASNNTIAKTRFRYLLLISILCSGSFFILLMNCNKNLYFNNEIYLKDKEQLDYKRHFTIETDGCVIPGMNAYDESIKQFVEYPKTLKKCKEHNISLIENNQTHIWINKNIMSEYNYSLEDVKLICCYRAFYRPNFVEDVQSSRVDDRIEYQDCINFSEEIEVNDEFVRVNCSLGEQLIYDDFFLFALKKKILIHDDKKEISSNKMTYNILILGIDAVSRLNFYRTMPKTLAYLKTKGAIDLAGYNKVGDNTFPNLIPMLLGLTPEELTKTCIPYKKATFDNCPFIWEWYKQAGFYTAFGEDSSSLGTFNYLKVGFINTPTDYYIHTFINEAEKKAGNNHDFNSYLCLNNKYFYNVLLNYIENLTITLKSSRLFGFFWEITMSHDYLNYPMIMDNDYVEFFEKLDKSDYLKDTILFLVSDHGIRWGGIRSTKQGHLEERLPFVFILVPPSFRETYTEAYNNIILNSKRLATPFDIHATLLDLMDLDNIQNEKLNSRKKTFYEQDRGISLFMPIPSNRTCKMAGITDHWCTCHRDNNIANNSSEAVEASTHLLIYLNKMLSEYEKCAKLKLVAIAEAAEIIASKSEDDKIESREIMTIIRTEPGNGIFEGTLRYGNGEWTMTGSVSRLNLYGNQSYCVDDNVIKLYCYCLSN
ncbi:uncharacterized protein LOC113516955 isoform X2 [Galleria mellonella]|nr:uncharacterized protein LOC113516955 isoform X2 [Galleria mellonella]